MQGAAGGGQGWVCYKTRKVPRDSPLTCGKVTIQHNSHSMDVVITSTDLMIMRLPVSFIYVQLESLHGASVCVWSVFMCDPVTFI